MSSIAPIRSGVRKYQPPVVKWLGGIWLLFALLLPFDRLSQSWIRGETNGFAATLFAIALLLAVLSWAHWKQFPVAWWFGAGLSALWIFELTASYTTFSGLRMIASVFNPQSAPRYIQNHQHWRSAVAFHLGLSVVSWILMLAAFIITSSQAARTTYGIQHFGRSNP